MSNKELGELTDKSGQIFTVIIFAVILSFSILIYLRFQTNLSEDPGPKESIIISSDSFPTIQLGHYALWAVDSQERYTLVKRFNSVNNQLVGLDSALLSELANPLPNTRKYVVTIENEGDRDERPNNFVLLSKDTSPEITELVLNQEFEDASLSYILATPTDGNETINELSGIWFTDEEKVNSSLALPVLDEQWKYETTLIYKPIDLKLSLGTFQNPESADSEGRYSLTSGGYNFPGEDFLNNLPEGLLPPINLTNGNFEIVLSLEPSSDGIDMTGEDVFLPIAKGNIPNDLKASSSEDLEFIYKPITLKIRTNE